MIISLSVSLVCLLGIWYVHRLVLSTARQHVRRLNSEIAVRDDKIRSLQFQVNSEKFHRQEAVRGAMKAKHLHAVRKN